MFQVNQYIKSLVPPVLLNIINNYRNSKYGWKGNYTSWQAAQKDSTGYDSEKILQAVKTSLLKVKRGEAVYERDSVIFDEIQYSWPLLSGVLLAAVKLGAVRVLDFGGSLGSTYYQNIKFLDQIENVSWNVVEQRNFVDSGKKEFEDERLKFFYTVGECVQKEQPNVLLLSSVLQYIEKPYELLDDLLENNFEYICIDRTPFNLDERDDITLQVVHPDIYDGSYPCWLFDRNSFMNYFISNNYSVIESFNGADGGNVRCNFGGVIFRKNV